jgi:hypothetical protein
MIGPYFREQRNIGNIEFFPGENTKDFEMLYTLILEVRGALPNPTKDDEQVSLTVLCGIGWPGKPPAYRAEAHEFRQRFRGVSNDPRLQREFRDGIAQSIRQARNPSDLSFQSVSDNFVIERGGRDTMGY